MWRTLVRTLSLPLPVAAVFVLCAAYRGTADVTPPAPTAQAPTPASAGPVTPTIPAEPTHTSAISSAPIQSAPPPETPAPLPALTVSGSDSPPSTVRSFERSVEDLRGSVSRRDMEAAIRQMQDAAPDRVVPALIEFLQEVSAVEWAPPAVVDALVESGDPSAVALFTQSLSDPTLAALGRAVSRRIDEIEDPSFVQTVTSLLRDRDARGAGFVEPEVVAGLAAHSAPEAREALWSLANDPSTPALTRGLTLRGSLQAGDARAMTALLERWPEEADPRRLVPLAMLAGEFGSRHAADPLPAALRQSAAQRLLPLLRERSPILRQAAARALRGFGDLDAATALESIAWNDADANVRREAHAAARAIRRREG